MATLSCRQVVEALSDYLEGAGPGGVGDHLDGCVACRTFLDQLRTTVALARRLAAAEAETPVPVSPVLLAAYRERTRP